MPSPIQIFLFKENQPGLDNVFLNLKLHTVREVSNDYKKVANKIKKIDVLNANIRSLDGHFEDLQAFLINNNLEPCRIALTETWLGQDSNDAVFNIEGYHKLVTCNRSWGDRGGVSLYIRLAVSRYQKRYRKGMASSRDSGTDETFGRYFLQVREEILKRCIL